MMIKKTFSSSASGAIGFIGLGQMGLPMALNLSKKFNLLAYDVMALDTLRLPPSITKASSLHQVILLLIVRLLMIALLFLPCCLLMTPCHKSSLACQKA